MGPGLESSAPVALAFVCLRPDPEAKDQLWGACAYVRARRGRGCVMLSPFFVLEKVSGGYRIKRGGIVASQCMIVSRVCMCVRV